MPLSANREVGRYIDQELRGYRVAANVRIYKGALVGLNRSNGWARPLQAGDAFVGIAYEEADASAAANGEKLVRVYTQGDFHLPVSGVTMTSIGRPVYATADDTLGLTPTDGASRAGACIDVPSSGWAIVRIAALAESQAERHQHALLTSAIGQATTNAVLIAQRPIVVLGAEVVFNTKPDAGNLDVGTGDTTPNELVSGFNLASLTNQQRTALTLAGSQVAAGQRVWARVGAATAAAGVGGLLTLRYIELP